MCEIGERPFQRGDSEQATHLRKWGSWAEGETRGRHRTPTGLRYPRWEGCCHFQGPATLKSCSFYKVHLKYNFVRGGLLTTLLVLLLKPGMSIACPFPTSLSLPLAPPCLLGLLERGWWAACGTALCTAFGMAQCYHFQGQSCCDV